jgi:hypothetical protein
VREGVSTMFDDERTEQLKEEIRQRLQHVCADLPRDSFEDLVQKIADQARKALLPDRGAADAEKGPGDSAEDRRT